MEAMRKRLYAGISKVGARGWSRIASQQGKAHEDVQAFALSALVIGI
jgi:hypothetical protein